MPSPYILPSDLIPAPLGVAWSTIGATDPGATIPTAAQNLAELTNICWRATELVDNEAVQTLRATIFTEQLPAPSHRVGILPNGNARFMTSFNPIINVVAGQYALGGPPFNWQTIPVDYMVPEESPILGVGSAAPIGATAGVNAILIGGQVIGWWGGRMGTRVSVTYENGWPHAGLTADVAAGAVTLTVDDVTGWAGVAGMIYDGANTETVQVLSVTPDTPGQVAPAGPGTLTLVTGTLYPHTAPVLVSALPASLRWAAMLAAKEEALSRGVPAVSPQELSTGLSAHTSSGEPGAPATTWQRLVYPFRRIY